MSHRPTPPLDPDERALAARLTGDPVASPSPALDAAILEAARASVAPATSATQSGAPVSAARHAASTHRRPRRRWPVGAGVAAALLVAVGVAWQLRPAPETRPEPWSEAPTTMQAMRAPEASSAADRAEAPPPTAERARAAVDVRQTAATPTEMPADPRSREPQPSVATARSQTPPPPPPAPPAAAETARMTAFGSDAVAAPQSSVAPVGVAAAPAVVGAPAPARSDATARRAAPMLEAFEDLPDHDEPPATADSPQVRAAWLERARELLDAGDIVAARASLAEFHRRHPDADLPPDLRALLD
ncbi:hypothetical protein ACF3M1_10185 [Luteimonas sp. WGS1318]|uniref:hypothetical protein n=1 Tax=Luteimonas sp. WGS1318 TaxID=3366815 RepID=UPI00372CED31